MIFESFLKGKFCVDFTSSGTSGFILFIATTFLISISSFLTTSSGYIFKGFEMAAVPTFLWLTICSKSSFMFHSNFTSSIITLVVLLPYLLANMSHTWGLYARACSVRTWEQGDSVTTYLPDFA